MTTARRKGYNFEVYCERRFKELGFIDVERQPLSGALPSAKYKSDMTAGIRTDDNIYHSLLVEIKRTYKKTGINFEVGWLLENEKYGVMTRKIPVLAFGLGGKPGQKLIVYFVIREDHYVSISGDISNLALKKMKFRGKKYLSMTKEKLDIARRRTAKNKIPTPSFDANDYRYFVFELEDFYKSITKDEEDKPAGSWFKD